MLRFEKELSAQNRSFLGTTLWFMNGLIVLFSLFTILVFASAIVELPAPTKYNYILVFQITALMGVLLFLFHALGMKIWLDICQWQTRQRALRVANVWIVCQVIISVLTLLMGVLLLSQQTRMLHAIVESARSSMAKYAVSAPAKFIADNIQIRFQCCGTHGMNDWVQNNWIDTVYLQQSETQEEQRDNENVNSVPYSCCNPKDHRPCVTDHVTSSSAHRHLGNTMTLYSRGCQEAIGEFITPIIVMSGIGMIMTWIIQVVIIFQTRYLYTSAIALKHSRSDGSSRGYFVDTNSFRAIWTFKPNVPDTKPVSKSNLLTSNVLHRERCGCTTCILNPKSYKGNRNLSSDFSLEVSNVETCKRDNCLKTSGNAPSIQKKQRLTIMNGTLNNPIRLKKSSSISEGLLKTDEKLGNYDYHASQSCVEIRTAEGNASIKKATHFCESTEEPHNELMCSHFPCSSGPKLCRAHCFKNYCQSGNGTLKRRNTDKNRTIERKKPSEDSTENLSNTTNTQPNNSYSEIIKRKKKIYSSKLRDTQPTTVPMIDVHQEAMNTVPQRQVLCENSTQTASDPSHIWRENAPLPIASTILNDIDMPNKLRGKFSEFHRDYKMGQQVKGIVQEEGSISETCKNTQTNRIDNECIWMPESYTEAAGCLSQESREVWRITQSISSKSQNTIGSSATANGANVDTSSIICLQQPLLEKHLGCLEDMTDISKRKCNHMPPEKQPLLTCLESTDASSVPSTKFSMAINNQRMEHSWQDRCNKDSKISMENFTGREQTNSSAYKKNSASQTTGVAHVHILKNSGSDETMTKKIHARAGQSRNEMDSEEIAPPCKKNHVYMRSNLTAQEKDSFTDSFSSTEELDTESQEAVRHPLSCNNTNTTNNTREYEVKSRHCTEVLLKKKKTVYPPNTHPEVLESPLQCREDRKCITGKRNGGKSVGASQECSQTKSKADNIGTSRMTRLTAGCDLSKHCEAAGKDYAEQEISLTNCESKQPYAGSLRPLQCKK